MFERSRSLRPTAPAQGWRALTRRDRGGRPRRAEVLADQRPLLLALRTRGHTAALKRADRRLLFQLRTRGHAALERADRRLLLALRTRGHVPALERAAGALGRFGEYGAGWAGVGLCGAVLHPAERRRWLAAASAGPVAVLLNYAVKLVARRARPRIDGYPPLGHATSVFSFPSAHATSATAAAVAIGRVAPAARPALRALAAAICLGRPYLGMHYPSDVVAGVALGAAIGRVYPLPAPAPDPTGTEDLNNAIVAAPPEVAT